MGNILTSKEAELLVRFTEFENRKNGGGINIENDYVGIIRIKNDIPDEIKDILNKIYDGEEGRLKNIPDQEIENILAGGV